MLGLYLPLDSRPLNLDLESIIFWTAKHSELLWEHWNDEAVIYNPLSGETHYLNRMAMEILSTLEQSPATCSTLMEGMAGRFAPEDTRELNHLVLQLLEELDQLGLIEPAK